MTGSNESSSYQQPNLPGGGTDMIGAIADAEALAAQGLSAVVAELREAAIEQVHQTSPVAGMLRLGGEHDTEWMVGMGDKLADPLDRLRRAIWAVEILQRDGHV
jgi:hypothetical protein